MACFVLNNYRMIEELEQIKEWLEEELYLAELWEDRKAVIDELGLEEWQNVLLAALELLN